jgi:hypothetical protein
VTIRSTKKNPDVDENGGANHDTGVSSMPVQEFGLHPAPERLDEGMVVEVADGIYRGMQARSRVPRMNALDLDGTP